ncbi:MAG: hypothetical protein HYX52_05590 [Chloroflexi bacterium]|nr:hypothetical protein [Chloroflexota bacterium]
MTIQTYRVTFLPDGSDSLMCPTHMMEATNAGYSSDYFTEADDPAECDVCELQRLDSDWRPFHDADAPLAAQNATAANAELEALITSVINEEEPEKRRMYAELNVLVGGDWYTRQSPTERAVWEIALKFGREIGRYQGRVDLARVISATLRVSTAANPTMNGDQHGH